MISQANTAFTLVDAGGSTADLSFLVCQSLLPRVTLQEVKTSDSVSAGGIHVTRLGAQLLHQKLKGSRFDSPDYLAEATANFNDKVKKKFEGGELRAHIKIAAINETDGEVHKGRLSLTQ